jgi:hypothetical protein
MDASAPAIWDSFRRLYSASRTGKKSETMSSAVSYLRAKNS